MNFNIVELVEPVVHSWCHFFLELVEASALSNFGAPRLGVDMDERISSDVRADC